jgi:hypothetical protein
MPYGINGAAAARKVRRSICIRHPSACPNGAGTCA